jgi:hypothetical protein
MATAEDYVGVKFGRFVIGTSIGSGAEAEVYQVYNEPTQRFLVLRLDGSDDSLWIGEPKTPPYNSSIELDNVRGSFFMKIQYHEAEADRREKKAKERRGSEPEDDWVISVLIYTPLWTTDI